jgi:hypothetical protein
MSLKKLLAAAVVLLGSMFASTGAHAAECSMYEQSHPNFTLDGAHLSTGKCNTCASCHKAGVFLGTPKNCVACHNGDPARVTVARSANHIPTGLLECNNCHFTSSFTTTWSMNHSTVSNIACSQCHGGTYASVYNALTKPTNHVPTTAECGTCHTTPANGSSFAITAWDTVSHDQIHAGVTSGCVTCHDNVIAKGKAAYTAGHPVTVDQCEQCHSTSAAFKCAQAYDTLLKYALTAVQKMLA